MAEEAPPQQKGLEPTHVEVQTLGDAKTPQLGKRSSFEGSCVFWFLAFIAVACIVVVAVVPPVCVMHGCGRGGKAVEDTSSINRLIVSFQTVEKTVKSIVPPALYEYVEEVLLASSGLHIVSFQDSKIMETVRKYIEAQPDLDIVFQDRVYSLPDIRLSDGVSSTPPALANMLARRHLSQAATDNYEDALWQRPLVNYDGAWNVTAGVANVVIAVLDTGCDLEHPDLKENLWTNPKESIGSSNVDDDGNGYIDDVYGYDFAGNTSLCDKDWRTTNASDCPGGQPIPQDINGHGTHCAGIAAAAYNGMGVVGVAPKAKVMCLKVAATANGRANYYVSNVLKALDYSYRMGAHVVSLSFGPDQPNLKPTASDLAIMSNETRAYQKALDPLVKKDMLIFAAAGNEDADLNQLAAVNSTYNPCTMARYFPNNMMCVMATDPQDNRWHEFQMGMWVGSNFGAKFVDIAAPGRMILSTVPANSAVLNNGDAMYLPLTGSSASTPLVAGVAALVLSVLGPGSNNFYQGAKALQILADSSDKLNLPVRTSGRVNAYRAVMKAQASLSNLVLLTPMPRFSQSSQTVMLSGFNETYYAGDIGLDDQDYSLLPTYDTSARFTKSYFDSYKYGAGYTLVLRASVFLNQSGTYLFKLNTTANMSNVVIVFGQNELSNLTQTLQLNTEVAGGWYDFQVRYRNPSAAIDIRMALPGSGGAAADYQYLNVFFTNTDAQPRNLYYAPDIALSSAFQVLTRPVANASAITRSSIADGPYPRLQIDQPYNYSSVVPDLAFTDMSTGLRDALYPNVTAPAAVVGVVITRLRAPDIPVRFQLTCQLCSLVINNLTVLDVYAATAKDVSTQNSGCMTQLGSAGAHDLVVRFALVNTSSAALKLAWLPCDAPATATATTITTHVANNWLWNPSSGTAGYVPGLQCDVWPDFLPGGGDVNMTYPASAQPWLKFRLPMALGQSAKSLNSSLMNATVYTSTFLPSGCRASNESFSSGCYSYSAFTLRDVFQSITSQLLYDSTPFYYVYVRCWTYVSRGFKTGVMQARASTNTVYTYLGSQTVFRSESNQLNRGPLNAASIAPNTTSLGGYYQLLSFEYRHVNPTLAMGILDGLNQSSVDSNFRIDMSSTLLPIPVVTTRTPVKVIVASTVASPPPRPAPRPPPSKKPPPPANRGLLQTAVSPAGYVPVALGCSSWTLSQVGSQGLATTVYPYNATAYYEALAGFSSLVVSNYTDTAAQAVVPVATALTGTIAVPKEGAGANRFIRFEGFMKSPAAAGQMATYVLRVKDGEGQGLAITMGNVTVRNAVEFPTKTLNQTRMEIVLPFGYVPTVVTIKNSRADSNVVLDLGLTSLGGTTETPFDWYSLT